MYTVDRVVVAVVVTENALVANVYMCSQRGGEGRRNKGRVEDRKEGGGGGKKEG
jgi:hypothetical protein